MLVFSDRVGQCAFDQGHLKRNGPSVLMDGRGSRLRRVFPLIEGYAAAANGDLPFNRDHFMLRGLLMSAACWAGIRFIKDMVSW